MRITGIIPARYGSSRFPGKPLALIAGKPMIIHTLESAQKADALDNVVVATDDERIYQVVTRHKGTCIMTPENIQTGTERCASALNKINTHTDAVINIQGDEPFIQTEHIRQICRMLKNGAPVATLVKKIASPDEQNSPHVVKVVLNQLSRALYFSRSPIPFIRNKNNDNNPGCCYYKHIGIYGYQASVLKRLAKLPQTPLEQAESLEQLRWMEHDFQIMVDITTKESKGIDTPQDLQELKKSLKDF